MSDQSYLDERYFVDSHVYNCPFCNRGHVSYSIYSHVSFDWTPKKRCHVYFVECHSCRRRSMHLSYKQIGLSPFTISGFQGRPETRWIFERTSELLDEFFFYSVPTSFFVLDNRIPEILRELLTEAEGSLKGNFLTGASACARKIIYELASIENAEGGNYEDRIKSLKKAHPTIDPTYFDTLLTIQQVTSSKVHENSYDGWDSRHLRVILATLREILHELYVVPALREDRRQSIIELKKELLSKDDSSEKHSDPDAAG